MANHSNILAWRIPWTRLAMGSHRMGFPGDSDCSLPAMLEMQVLSLGQEDPLEDVLTTHSSILAWEIPGTEEPGEL